MADASVLMLQAYWKNQWRDAGEIRFFQPERGLAGDMRFVYETEYVSEAFDVTDSLDFIDERAVSVNLPGSFTAQFNQVHAGPVLRDIIPQGAGRRTFCRQWGVDRDPGPSLDLRLLADGAISPIGNLRIKEAYEGFMDRVDTSNPVGFTREDVATRTQNLLDHAYNLGVAIGGASGAGGDAPKLLLVENTDGLYFLEGTLPEDEIVCHWLVKFPRGRTTQNDVDVLRGEAIYYQALAYRGFCTIEGALLEDRETPSLWLPRFDRAVNQNGIERYGVESVYSILRMIGDGTALNHVDVLNALTKVADTDNDDLLVEYLARDAVNLAIGNSDNHGRNTAILKRDGCIFLAPAYDLAPMVMDDEGIARTTRWPDHLRQDALTGDYRKIINALAHNPEQVRIDLQEKFASLADFQVLVTDLGIPQSVLNHPRVNLNRFDQWAEELNVTHKQSNFRPQ